MFDPFRAARERSSAGVRALIDSPRLRRHPFGAAVGALLARVDPSGSLGPKGIDPIHEAQRIFVQSPGLRDSSEVVMLVQHRIADADLRARLARPITPSSSLVVVAPERLAPIATELASLVALPPSPPPSFIWAHVETPWRAFLETPVSLPRSLRWIEVRIAPDSDGGMTLRFEAEDEEERSAPLDARSIAAAISVALHLLASADVAREPSPEQVPVIEFHARSSIIVGTCRFSAAQVADLVERIRSRLGETAATP